MEIVIKIHDIPTNDHERWILKYGIPLPKHHGRLIDVDELLDDIGLEDNDENRVCNTGEIITLEDIDRISIIIPATKEKSCKTCAHKNDDFDCHNFCVPYDFDHYITATKEGDGE